jgi:hypothetical protein
VTLQRLPSTRRLPLTSPYAVVLRSIPLASAYGVTTEAKLEIDGVALSYTGPEVSQFGDNRKEFSATGLCPVGISRARTVFEPRQPCTNMRLDVGLAWRRGSSSSQRRHFGFLLCQKLCHHSLCLRIQRVRPI